MLQNTALKHVIWNALVLASGIVVNVVSLLSLPRLRGLPNVVGVVFICIQCVLVVYGIVLFVTALHDSKQISSDLLGVLSFIMFILVDAVNLFREEVQSPPLILFCSVLAIILFSVSVHMVSDRDREALIPYVNKPVFIYSTATSYVLAIALGLWVVTQVIREYGPDASIQVIVLSIQIFVVILYVFVGFKYAQLVQALYEDKPPDKDTIEGERNKNKRQLYSLPLLVT
tara:strand:+ start:1050 stop:1736 length:687 start_codon:yes stop_codon:yes gene_type:complete